MNDAQLRARALAQALTWELGTTMPARVAELNGNMEIAEMLREEEVVRARRNANQPPQPR